MTPPDLGSRDWWAPADGPPPGHAPPREDGAGVEAGHAPATGRFVRHTLTRLREIQWEHAEHARKQAWGARHEPRGHEESTWGAEFPSCSTAVSTSDSPTESSGGRKAPRPPCWPRTGDSCRAVTSC
jgi:hypothetical protein